MAVYHAAKRRLISKNIGGTLRNPRGVILHTAASEANGERTYQYWNRDPKAGASSHFYVDRDGTVWQLVDTSRIAFTSGRANTSTIGVETQGHGHEPWTPAQVRALASLLAWCAKTHGIPLAAMPDSKAGRRGVGWHALGVPATRLQKLRGVSQTGGELWSSAVGKVCPGAKRIAQIPGILQAARTGTPAAPKPTPTAAAAGSPGALAVDGALGPKTVAALQQINGTPVDGLITGQAGTLWTSVFRRGTGGSVLVRKLQRAWGTRVDGQWGPATWAAAARYYRVSANTATTAGREAVVKAMQAAINRQRGVSA